MSLSRMQQRRGTNSQWSGVGTSVVLAAGEIGFISDNPSFKIGDGSPIWNTLPVFKSDTYNALTYSKLTADQTFIGTQTVTNSGTGYKPLIVNAILGTTVNVQEWLINGTSLASISQIGRLTVAEDIVVSGGDIFTSSGIASGLFSNTTTGNITIGGALTTGTFTVGSTGSTGAVSLFPATGAQSITLGGATTGTITIGSTLSTAVQLPTGKTKIGQTTIVQGGAAVSVTLPTSAGTLVSTGNTSVITSVGTLTALTVTGTTTNPISLTTGTTGSLTLDTGTTGAINIGTNANTKTITIGSSTGTVQLPTGTTKIGQTTITQGGAVNITLPTIAGTLVGSGDTSLPSSITSSSLTTVGTLASPTLTTPTINGGKVASDSYSTTQTLTTSNDLVFLTASSASWTLTLPAPTAGKILTMSRNDSSANVISVSGHINGVASTTNTTWFPASTGNRRVVLISNGTSWYPIVAGTVA
jgi:hypothetical protein